MKYGYWSDLALLRLDDASTATWIQAMPVGKYEHPVHGEINITPDKITQFADNVKNNVRGQELDIDYDHKANGGEAAGWVKDAEARPDGLWLLVEWTQAAYQKLKDKAYRYFSPEYNDEWKHPKSGQQFNNVLFGGAITNRPFLKDIMAINMSELIQGVAPPTAPPPPTEPSEGGTQEVDGKELRKNLGLAEDVDDTVVAAKLAELMTAGQPPPPTPPTPPTPLTDQTIEQVIKSLNDLPGNPAIKQLTDLVKAQQAQLVGQSTRLREIEVDKKLDDLDRGKKFTVPPVVKERLREVLMNSAPELAEQVFEAYQSTLELGLIDMTERGWQRRNGEQSPTQRYLTEIDQLMAESKQGGAKGLTYAEAAARVAASNPQLAEEYRQDSYIPAEGR
jgi:Mu-like prophage I protein